MSFQVLRNMNPFVIEHYDKRVDVHNLTRVMSGLSRHQWRTAGEEQQCYD